MKNSTAHQHQASLNISELMTIGKIESHYLRFRRNYIYTALEEVDGADFFWSRDEVKEFEFWWKKDKPITEIAEEMERTETAVLLLALDRLSKERIKPRNWRIW
jgi:hypothetical protein